MKRDPLISVLMSVYNEPIEYLDSAIQSILNQSYDNFEFIIVLDNPNSELLRKALLVYQDNDKRIKIVENEKNIGLAESLNKGLRISRGKYIARMDADDISLPNRFFEEISYLESNPRTDMVCSGRINMDECGNLMPTVLSIPKSDENLLYSLKYGSIITHPTIMIKKNVIQMVGGYDNYPCGQDYALWLKLSKHGYKIHYVDAVLLHYRKHNKNMSSSLAYLQWLCSEYARKCNNNNYAFSRDDFDIFVKKKEASSNKKIYEKFMKTKQSKSPVKLLYFVWVIIVSSDCRHFAHNAVCIKKHCVSKTVRDEA